MRIFGYDISFKKTTLPAQIDRTSWWWPIVNEPFTGAWQRNQDMRFESLLSNTAIYRCITMISGDIAKMRIKLVENVEDDVWVPVSSAAFSPVLKKPNDYQTRIQFIEDWVRSKLMNGNTYVLKGRDARGVVVQLFVLNPLRVKVYVQPDGDPFYQLQGDDLVGLFESEINVPASEIIHDRYNPLYHPLCGIPPLAACALAGALGISIQRNSANFFQNASVPGGIITAPHVIDKDTAERLKNHWETNYTGDKRGRVAVLGDGLKFEVMRETAVDAQLAEQLKLSAELVCMAFGVPPYMIGAGEPPNFNNIEALNQQYFSQCLQILIESIEILLDEGLKLENAGRALGTEFCVTDLLRMDTATKVKSWSDLVKGGIASPNEARAAFDMLPVTGGESPMLQQQNFSLAALAKRDAKDDPFESSAKAPAAIPDEPKVDEDVAARAIDEIATQWLSDARQQLALPRV